MFTEHPASVIRMTATVVLALGLAGSLVRAGQNTQFTQKTDELSRQWSAERQKLGLDNNALKARFPCAEITLARMVSVRPGASAAVSMTGTFADGTVFLSEHDGAELSGGSVAKGVFTGRIIVKPDQFPAFVRIWAFTPVTGTSDAEAAAFIDAVPAFDLKSANGWTIKAVPTAKTFTIANFQAVLSYRVEFYRPNESKPFQAAPGELRINGNDAPSPTLDLNIREGMTPAQAELEAISRQMSDINAFLKLSEAEQNAITNKLSTLTEQMMAEVMASMKDPAAMQKQQDDFGCRSIRLTRGQGSVTGQVFCGKNVGNPNVGGTMSVVR
jgi:hypothetical protein